MARFKSIGKTPLAISVFIQSNIGVFTGYTHQSNLGGCFNAMRMQYTKLVDCWCVLVTPQTMRFDNPEL
jgi:hypothetical protein